MRNVLLVMSTTRKSPRSMRVAAELAEERNSKLFALFVLNIEYPRQIVNKLASEGWIGGKPSDDFYRVVIAEREAVAENKLTEAVRVAEGMGVETETLVREGPLLDEVRNAVEELGIGTVVVTRRRRSELSRLFLGSPVAELKKKLPCEVVVVDE